MDLDIAERRTHDDRPERGERRETRREVSGRAGEVDDKSISLLLCPAVTVSACSNT